MKDNRTNNVIVCLTPEQKEKLEEYAKQDGRSLSGMMREILIEYIKHREAL